MEYGQLSLRLAAIPATKHTYIDAMCMMVRTGLVEGMEPTTVLSADQVAQLIYLSAGTSHTNRAAAVYAISEDKACAWCEEAHCDIISYLAFLIQDTWRPFGMVDHITFFRNSGAAVSVQETNRHQMRRFDGCLPQNETGKDDSTLTGWELMRIAAAFCGDIVITGSHTPLTTIQNETKN